MQLKPFLIGLAVCGSIGAVLAVFTPVKWLAAILWISGAMFINGSLAVYEDARPGGFENPDGSSTPKFAQGIGALKFWLQALVISGIAISAGFYVQFK
jgi:hypothetical protein